ncbi:MAG: MBL fold metallo-hydrolase [Chloroflexi bacterium]|nr:MBL fold metallo-hydrolase [Chloroflexota bacterium]MQC18601.1 MBL fold metallo-hydrolase [Chloroflexota bacterium]
MGVTVDWLGCATFRIEVDGLVVFLDTYMDRPDGAPATGMTAADVDRADFALIGHSHWDHLAQADVVALNTGATVIGSHESARVLREHGVPEAQLGQAQGGEHYRLNDAVTVRVYPSLHSHIWSQSARAGTPVLGDYGVVENDRQARLTERRAARGRTYFAEMAHSNSTGGPLDYLIETPYGSILFQDSMGYFTGLYALLHPDVALLAASGRGNVDGEPIQGAVEDFVVRECELLRPSRVVLSHHDNFAGVEGNPDVADLTPVHEALARVLPRVEVLPVDLGGRLTLW